jgi:hypothetical protein
MLGLSTDYINQTVWIHSTRTLFSLDFGNEKKNIWISYVKKGKLAKALELTKDTEHQPLVRGIMGDQ